jgi:YegS/Rv2252/BmrU family lipid kinase
VYVTILNPAAGGGRCGRRAREALDSLREAGVQIEVYLTSRAGEATEIARGARADGHDRFLCIGGDGTAFEVLNGLFPRPAGDSGPLTLATLPLGTGNSFLRDFGVTDVESAFRAIIAGRTRTCDVIRFAHDGGEIHYINLVSLAFSARAATLTNERFKPLGPFGYILAVLSCVAGLTFPVIPIRLDGEEPDRRPCALLSFSNSKFTGGTMMMAPAADPTDGMLDVIRVGEMSRLSFTATFPDIFAGTHTERPEVEQARARRVTFVDPEEQDVMVDGEVMRLVPRSLSVLPGAIEIVA